MPALHGGVDDVQRVLLIAPITFVIFAALGLQNVIGGWFSPAPAPILSGKVPGRLLAPASAAAQTQVIATLVAAAAPEATTFPSPTAPLRGDAASAPSATPRPAATSLSPTSIPPTATPWPSLTPPPTSTTRPTNAPAPRKVGQDMVPKVSAKQFVVVDGESGEVLAEQGSHQRVSPASTTKIITALVALAHNNLNEKVTAQFDQSELVDSTLMGLRNGDQVTLEDLLYGLMLPSGNDAALAIATYVAGTKARFVKMMNDLTAEMGLVDSHWVNPHGLDASGHYSSAYDMVQFARAAMRDPRFQPLASARSRTVQVGGRTYNVFNLNRVLGAVPGADGVKIGYTDDAGRTIVASATRNGHRIFVGAFHSTDLVADSRPLIEWAFKNYSWN